MTLLSPTTPTTNPRSSGVINNRKKFCILIPGHLARTRWPLRACPEWGWRSSRGRELLRSWGGRPATNLSRKEGVPIPGKVSPQSMTRRQPPFWCRRVALKHIRRLKIIHIKMARSWYRPLSNMTWSIQIPCQNLPMDERYLVKRYHAMAKVLKNNLLGKWFWHSWQRGQRGPGFESSHGQLLLNKKLITVSWKRLK